MAARAKRSGRRISPAVRVATMWSFSDRVADLEARVGRIYDYFADQLGHRPRAAAFWREVAAEERLHALFVAAAREVFPPTAPAPTSEWIRRLRQAEKTLSEVEAQVTTPPGLTAMFGHANTLETSELSALTALIIQLAGPGFSRLGPLIDFDGLERHRNKFIEAQRRLGASETA